MDFIASWPMIGLEVVILIGLLAVIVEIRRNIKLRKNKT